MPSRQQGSATSDTSNVLTTGTFLGCAFDRRFFFGSVAFSANFLEFLGRRLPPDCCGVFSLEAWLVPSPWLSLVTILARLISFYFSSLPFRTLKSRKSPQILLASFFQLIEEPLTSFHSLLLIHLSSSLISPLNGVGSKLSRSGIIAYGMRTESIQIAK